jgi:hypothetical protein
MRARRLLVSNEKRAPEAIPARLLSTRAIHQRDNHEGTEWFWLVGLPALGGSATRDAAEAPDDPFVTMTNFRFDEIAQAMSSLTAFGRPASRPKESLRATRHAPPLDAAKRSRDGMWDGTEKGGHAIE